MDVYKPSLIDLETQAWVTGRKTSQGHRERLSERGVSDTKGNTCDSLTPSHNVAFEAGEGDPKSSPRVVVTT